jgi:uncharacterized membrane-anchored protein
MRSGSIGHPLFEKFTPDHITKFLDINSQDNENEHNFKSSNRWFHLVYAIIFLGFLMFLITYLLPNNIDLLKDVIGAIVLFAGGFGGGYGYKSMKK